MTAIKAAKAASRERSSSQNGQPELVPYVYRQQQRRNTYAARIARRNAQEWGRPADQGASADDALPIPPTGLKPHDDLQAQFPYLGPPNP